MQTLLHGDVTERILGGFFTIHRGHGYGFSEEVYSNSLAIELGLMGLKVAREVPTRVFWKGHSVGTYRLDLVVNDCVIVEVKTCDMLCMDHERQLMN